MPKQKKAKPLVYSYSDRETSIGTVFEVWYENDYIVATVYDEHIAKLIVEKLNNG